MFEIEIPQENSGTIPIAPNRYVISVGTKAVKSAWIDAVKALINVTITSKEYKPDLTPRMAPGGTDTEDEVSDQSPAADRSKLEDITASDTSELDGETSKSKESRPRSSNSSIRKGRATTAFNPNFTLLTAPVEPVTRTKSLSEIAAASKKPGPTKSVQSLNVFASQGRISSETTSSQTALDSVTKMTITTLRNRLKEQEKLIQQQSEEIDRASGKIIELEKKSAEISQDSAQKTQQILSLTSEKEAFHKQFESVKTDTSQTSQSFQLTIAQLKTQLDATLQERNELKQCVEKERFAWDLRLENEKQDMRRTLDHEVELIRSQMEQQNRALAKTIEELQTTAKKREEHIVKLEAEKMQQMASFTQEMTKGSTVAQNVEMLQQNLVEANTAVHAYRETISTMEEDSARNQQTSRAELTKHTAEKQLQISTLQQQLQDRELQLEQSESAMQTNQLEREESQKRLEQALQLVQELSSNILETQASLEKSQQESRERDIMITKLNSVHAQLVPTLQRHSENVAIAETTIQELRLQNEKHREQARDLQETIARMDTESQQHHVNLEAVMLELTSAAAAYESLEERFEKAQADLQRLEGVEQEFYSLQQKYLQLENEEDRLYGVETEHSRLRSDFKRLEEALQSTESILRDTKQSLDTSVQKEQETVNDLSATRLQLQDTISQLQKKKEEYQSLFAEKQETEGALASAKVSIATLESVKTQLDQEVHELKHKMRAASVLKKRWKDSETDNAELKSKLDTALQKITQLENALQVLHGKEQDAQKQIQGLQTDLQTRQGTIHGLEDTILARTKDRSILVTVFSSLSTRMDLEPFADVDAIEEDKLLSVVEGLEKLQQQRAGLADELRALQSKHQGAEELISSLESDIQTLQENHQTFEVELRAAFEKNKQQTKEAHQQEIQRSSVEYQQALLAKEQEVARMKELIQSTDKTNQANQERWETQLESQEENNQKLIGQVQLLMNTDDDRRDAKIWSNKFDGLQIKYTTTQKDMISLQAEVADLREQLESAVVELDNQEEDILLKNAELRHANETVQGLKLRIQNLVQSGNGRPESRDMDDLQSSKYYLERDNQKLQTQVQTLHTKLQQLTSQPPPLSSMAANASFDMLPERDFSPIKARERQTKSSLDHYLTPVATKDRPSTEMSASWKTKESEIYQRINGCLRNLSELTRIRTQYEREITSILGMDDDQKSASMTLQFLELATKVDAISVQNSGAFEKGIGSMRSEFAYILGSVKELVEEFLRLSMHKQGEQSVLEQELQNSTQAAQSLRSKNQELHEEITQLHVEFSRRQERSSAMEGIAPEWREQEHEMDDEMVAIQNQLLSVFEPLVQSDPYVGEKAVKLRDMVSLFLQPGTVSDEHRTLFTPERFKAQLRLVKGFLQAVAIHAPTLLRRQSEALATPKAERSSSVVSNTESLITHSELQRSLNAANVIIQRLKSSLQEASNENDRSKQFMDTHRKELKRLKDAYVQLKQVLREREEELSRLRTALSHKEEEMRDLFTEKASISQIVMQACTELEDLVVE